MDMVDLVNLRKSVRSFSDKTIEAEKLKSLREFFKSCRHIDDSIKTKTELVEKNSLPNDISSTAGYNGIMIEAPYYVIIFSENKPYFVENAGYMGEDIILKLTEMGIDSCWITLEQDYVFNNTKNNMNVCGLIAVGYGDNTGKKDVFNRIVYENGYKNLESKKLETDNKTRMDLIDIVYFNDYGNKSTMDRILETGIQDGLFAAREAPSALNRQPWRFIIDGEHLVLVIKKDEYTSIYDAKIDAGAVMFNFASVISERLFNVKWTMGSPNKKYNIPEDCVIVGYCGI